MSGPPPGSTIVEIKKADPETPLQVVTALFFVFGLIYCLITFMCGASGCDTPGAEMPAPTTRIDKFIYNLPSEWEDGYKFERWNRHGVCD